MPEPQGEDRQVKFHFENDPGYRIVAANGVWSGITPRGDMQLDFFVESIGTPSQVVNLITPEGLYAKAATKLESQELAFEREKLAFQTIPPNILARHVGNFVAVRAGQILDADPDLPTLMTRFFRKYGEGAAYITRIGDDQDDLRIDTPFFDEG